MLVLLLAAMKAVCVVTSVASGDTMGQLLMRLALESVVVCTVSLADAAWREGGVGALWAGLRRLPGPLVAGVVASDFFLDFFTILGIQKIGHAGNAAVGMVDVLLALAFDCAFHRRRAAMRGSDYAVTMCITTGLYLYFTGQGKAFDIDDYEGCAASLLSAVCMQLSVTLERRAVQASQHRPCVLLLTHALAPFVCCFLLLFHPASAASAADPTERSLPVAALCTATLAKAGYMSVKLTMHTRNFSNVYHTVMTSAMLLLRFAMACTSLVTKRVEHNAASYAGLLLLAAGAGLNHRSETRTHHEHDE